MKELYRKMTWPMRRTYQKVKRVIDFIPILWNGYDFDYRYAVELFRHQLNRTADFLDSDRSWTKGAESRAKRIRMVTELMEKVYDEDYALEYQEKMEEVWGEGYNEWHWVPIGHETKDEIPDDWNMDNEELVQLEWEYQRWNNADEVEEMNTKLFKESQEKQERAHKLLWELVEHNIGHWWD